MAAAGGARTGSRDEKHDFVKQLSEVFVMVKNTTSQFMWTAAKDSSTTSQVIAPQVVGMLEVLDKINSASATLRSEIERYRADSVTTVAPSASGTTAATPTRPEQVIKQRDDSPMSDEGPVHHHRQSAKPPTAATSTTTAVAASQPAVAAAPTPVAGFDSIRAISQRYEVPISKIRRLNPHVATYSDTDDLPRNLVLRLREKLPEDTPTSDSDVIQRPRQVTRRTATSTATASTIAAPGGGGSSQPQASRKYTTTTTSTRSEPQQADQRQPSSWEEGRGGGVSSVDRRTDKRQADRGAAARGGSTVDPRPGVVVLYDTIRDIAVRHGVSVVDLATSNAELEHFDLDDPLPPGLDIFIPPQRWVETCRTEPGDSLAVIADDLGIPVEQLAGLNEQFAEEFGRHGAIPPGLEVIVPQETLVVIAGDRREVAAPPTSSRAREPVAAAPAAIPRERLQVASASQQPPQASRQKTTRLVSLPTPRSLQLIADDHQCSVPHLVMLNAEDEDVAELIASTGNKVPLPAGTILRVPRL